MKITKVKIFNFRILENVTVDFDEVVTLIVGRNNSGKTSLAEVFNNFFSSSEKSRFRFEDFTLSTHKKSLKALKRYERYIQSVNDNEDEKTIEKREKLYKMTFPKIIAEIYLEYSAQDDGKLSSISNLFMPKQILTTSQMTIQKDYQKGLKATLNLTRKMILLPKR